MPRGYFIGLDAGTSGVKAIAVDARGRLLASASSPLTLQAPRPGWAEQDPDAWWRAAVSSLKALQGDRRLKGMRPEALGLSGQMHSSVFLDEAGTVIRPALLWCDGRTTAQCQAITKKVGESRLRQWVSNPALEGFTLPKVLWLRETEPAAFRRLRTVLLAKDYLRFKLSGVLATDFSDAAGTLMLDVAKRRWSAELLKALKLDGGLLPALGESSEILSVVSAAGAKASGLPQGLPIAGGGADNACGAVGVGAVTHGTAVASWGTSGTVLAPLARPKVDPGLRAHTFCSAVPGQWYVMGVMLSAGASFAWYRDQLRGGADSLSLNREAAAIAPGAEGLTFLPYLSGERTPHRDASARGALAGLSLSHTKAHVSRAVLEGICFGLRDAVEILRGLKLPLRSILLTGGGAKSPLLRRLQADIYGVPVQTVDKEEGPAYGAALLGMVSVGAHKSVAAACQTTLKRGPVLKPDARAHEAYAAPYARFRSLYPALKTWSR